MAHGGKREGAGRPKGARNRNTQAIVERLGELDYCPLERMVDMLDREDLPPDVEFKIHSFIAARVHPTIQPLPFGMFSHRNGINRPQQSVVDI